MWNPFKKKSAAPTDQITFDSSQAAFDYCLENTSNPPLTQGIKLYGLVTGMRLVGARTNYSVRLAHECGLELLTGWEMYSKAALVAHAKVLPIQVGDFVLLDLQTYDEASPVNSTFMILTRVKPVWSATEFCFLSDLPGAVK